jgi:arginyl-tRNA synthetase
MQDPDKVIVRSNGVVTYVGKDIAYQLWKFGLLGLDFQYRAFDPASGSHSLWTTCTAGGDPSAPHFGGADIVYNVIDQRQSYLQKVVAEGLRALGYESQAGRSIHFSYEMVTLSPKTAKMLGFELSAEEEDRAFVEMSGRKGIGVKADDLIDRLRDSAKQRVADLYREFSEKESADLAAGIATAALRYFMIRYTRNTIINFDMDEALSFEGETGPYLQYSMVRAHSIFRKLRETGAEVDAISDSDAASALQLLDAGDAEAADSWQMLIDILRSPDIIARCLRSLELSTFARHVFELARSFNNYYHKYPVLHEKDPQRRLLRIVIVSMFAKGMSTNLELLGIPVPERM